MTTPGTGAQRYALYIFTFEDKGNAFYGVIVIRPTECKYIKGVPNSTIDLPGKSRRQ